MIKRLLLATAILYLLATVAIPAIRLPAGNIYSSHAHTAHCTGDPPPCHSIPTND